MSRLSLFLILTFFLSLGCYQSSLTPMMMAGPVAGAAQGKMLSSTISTGINYVVKLETGKFPYEHIIKREKEKIIKKAHEVETRVILAKNNIKSKITETSEPINQKIKTVSKNTFAALKPRYSYWSTKK